jgi:hypothetical protein
MTVSFFSALPWHLWGKDENFPLIPPLLSRPLRPPNLGRKFVVACKKLIIVVFQHKWSIGHHILYNLS